MTPGQGELVQYRLARAMESLDEARLLLTNGHVRTVVNRIYYPCFYAVSALLLTEDQSSPKHSGVRSLFDQLRVASGRLPKGMGQLYRRLFDSRQKGDYDDLVTFDPKEVHSWLVEATRFVNRISETIEQGSGGDRGSQ